MSPSAVDIADRLREIARTLQRIDHPLGDWFDESVRLALLGVPLSEALGWSHGYEARVRQEAQDEALIEMTQGLPAGTSASAKAAVVQRQLRARPPAGPAADEMRAPR